MCAKTDLWLPHETMTGINKKRSQKMKLMSMRSVKSDPGVVEQLNDEMSLCHWYTWRHMSLLSCEHTSVPWFWSVGINNWLDVRLRATHGVPACRQ